MPLADDIRWVLASHADPAKAEPMRAYMKSEMPFLGVQKKARVEVERAFRDEVRRLDAESWRALAAGLWTEAAHREERYLALAVIRMRARDLVAADLPWLRELVVQGAWWDLVDEIAGQVISPWVLREPSVLAHMDRWIRDPDLWVRRAALLSQLKCKESTDQERLFAYVLETAHERDFFIRKAIGWALRQYAYVDPDAVRRFVNEHEPQLSGLSVREALKHLDSTHV
ncbi:MAG: DNA alkylation repair protein [Myxococcota bacterium]